VCTFSGLRDSPIRRIAAAGVLPVAAACNQLGLGNKNPTAPSGPPTAGSAIVYSAIGASDATGHGASVECVPLTDCPTGAGYVQVTTRTLKAQGFNVTLNNLGLPHVSGVELFFRRLPSERRRIRVHRQRSREGDHVGVVSGAAGQLRANGPLSLIPDP
jgi:hypothetical protein